MILQSNNCNNLETRANALISNWNNDCVDHPPPSHNNVIVEIQWLKNKRLLNGPLE